jgi:hypothetical protein
MDASTRRYPEIIHTRFPMAHERDPVVRSDHDDSALNLGADDATASKVAKRGAELSAPKS